MSAVQSYGNHFKRLQVGNHRFDDGDSQNTLRRMDIGGKPPISLSNSISYLDAAPLFPVGFF
jgi:hypothetical protein